MEIHLITHDIIMKKKILFYRLYKIIWLDLLLLSSYQASYDYNENDE